MNALGICLAGLTASGKSALALQLAEQFPIDIVSGELRAAPSGRCLLVPTSAGATSAWRADRTLCANPVV